MATVPQNNNLPILYNELVPLSSNDHATWKTNPLDVAPYLVGQHAVPLTIEEFTSAQRFYPIVFSSGPQPVPLALMGLNEGVNTFVDDEGKLVRETYVPAYVRRYPFMLARLRPGVDELSLCFDPTANAISAEGEGPALFEEGKPTEVTQNMLEFCEQFERAAQQTQAFVQELMEAKLLIDGEVTIQPDGSDKPFIYRGFQMVAEEKMRELRGDSLRKMSKNGMLPLIYAHMMSLPLMREIFGRQMAMGKVPTQEVVN